jgi:uncharacterized protein (TIGR03382 family)
MPTTRILSALLLALLVSPARAQSLFHPPIRLEMISAGSSAEPDADYVVLRLDLSGPGACTLDGVAVTLEDARGQLLPCFVRLEGPPPRTTGVVLVATPRAEEALGLRADYVTTCAEVPLESGRVCVVRGTKAYDCVAYGQYTGDNGAGGPPADGLPLDRTLVRVQATGYNQTDWQSTPTADPGSLLADRPLQACATDGGPAPSVDAGSDVFCPPRPNGSLCPTTRFQPLDGSATDGGATPSDGGADGGRGSTTSPGGGSAFENPPEGSSCCNAGGPGAAVFFLPLAGIYALRRRRRDEARPRSPRD